MHKEHPARTFDAAPMKIWACTESYDVHRDVLQPKLKKYLDPARIVDETFVKKNTWGSIKYKAEDGTITEISFKSYDQGRRMFQGAGVDLIWFDEEPPRDIWEECTVREEGARQFVNNEWVEKSATSLLNVILTMTPVNGMTWVYDELFLATGNPSIRVMLASWQDNPWLSDEQRARMAGNLTPEALQVRRDGKFTRMTGLVCSWFDRSVHVQDFALDPQWSRYRILDPGFLMGCLLYVAVDPDDNWYLYDGHYGPGMTETKWHEMCVRKDAQQYITGAWCDSAAASVIAALDQLGTHFDPVEKTPGEGSTDWDEWRASLLEQQGKVQRGAVTSKIIVSPKLLRYDEKKGKEVNWAVAEFESLRWEEVKVAGVVTAKNRWGKQAKHFIDTLTYFAHEYRKMHGFPESPYGKAPAKVADVPGAYVPVDGAGYGGYDRGDAYDV